MNIQEIVDEFEDGYRYGYIQHEYQGDDDSPVVVIIGDIHCNVGVQTSILDITSILVEKYDFRQINVEGSSDKIDVSHFRTPGYHSVLQDKFRDGEVTAPEYLAIESRHHIDLRGMEDEALYRKNLAAMKAVLDNDSSWHIFTLGMHSSLKEVVDRTEGELRDYAVNLHDKHEFEVRALLPEFYRLQADQEKYQSLLKIKEDLDPMRLMDAYEKAGLKESILERNRANLEGAVKHYLNAFLYYECATERDSVMLENALKNMRESNLDLTIIVAGDFHLHAMHRILQEKKISHINIVPAKLGVDSTARYFDLMRNQ